MIPSEAVPATMEPISSFQGAAHGGVEHSYGGVSLSKTLCDRRLVADQTGAPGQVTSGGLHQRIIKSQGLFKRMESDPRSGSSRQAGARRVEAAS